MTGYAKLTSTGTIQEQIAAIKYRREVTWDSRTRDYIMGEINAVLYKEICEEVGYNGE